MSEIVGDALVAWRVSSAHCCLALSICRRLLMQTWAWEVVRDLTKLGIAIAANRPMMATTIMISTSVKPDGRSNLSLTTVLLSFLKAEVPRARHSCCGHLAQTENVWLAFTVFNQPDSARQRARAESLR